MYTLHIANKNYSSWSLRPWVLMKVLNIPFTEKLHPFPESSAWGMYRTFSPTGKVPCLQHEDTPVWDSLAIAEYLGEQHKNIWPTDKNARAWARCASAEMHSGFQALRNDCGMNCGLRIQLHQISPALQKDISRIDELWSQGLEKFGGPFLTGEKFTAVDAFFAPVAFRAQTYGLTFSDKANTYLQTLLALPAMKEWYEAALLEKWREREHEAEVLASGKVIADHRISVNS
jgi:glutathione S-transferase